jgi:hypothetical protein
LHKKFSSTLNESVSHVGVEVEEELLHLQASLAGERRGCNIHTESVHGASLPMVPFFCWINTSSRDADSSEIWNPCGARCRRGGGGAPRSGEVSHREKPQPLHWDTGQSLAPVLGVKGNAYVPRPGATCSSMQIWGLRGTR